MHQGSTSRRLVAAFTLCAVVVVGSVAVGTGAGASTSGSPNQNYVGALFSDLLDRPDIVVKPSSYWVSQLDRHLITRGQAASRIQRSTDEYYRNIVQFNFQLFLDRPAGPGEPDFHIIALRNRLITVEASKEILIASNEYNDAHGPSDQAFVSAVFQDVVGREPTAAELSSNSSLPYSQGRAAVVARLVTSLTARRATVAFAYHNFLGREATSAELSYWAGRLGGGLRIEDFDASIVSSPEYYNKNS